MQKSAEKSQKLKEANKQQNFNTGIKDFDFWLSEVTPGRLPSAVRVTGDRRSVRPSTSPKPREVGPPGAPLSRNLHPWV